MFDMKTAVNCFIGSRIKESATIKMSVIVINFILCQSDPFNY